MIRLSKLTDYAIVLMTLVARGQGGGSQQAGLGENRGSQQARGAWAELHTARDLARESGVPLPTVSKILKALSQAGLLISTRGVKGGYSLSRVPQEISVAEIILALEGPIAVTECGAAPKMCELEHSCPCSNNWRIISRALRDALENLPLSDLLAPLPMVTARELVRLNVPNAPVRAQ
jgi:FeS assembly SUF system regulator